MSTQTPHLLYQLTEALNFLGRLEESVNELQIAVRLFPENGDFHCQLGKTYMMLKEYDKAKISYETAVKLQPRSMSAYYGLFVVCTRLGMTDQSNQAMKQFRKLQGESLPVQWGPSDGTDDALSCRRGFAMTCADAGTIYLDNGMPGKAEPLLRRAAAVDPENIGCRIQLAELLYSAEPGAGDRFHRPGTDRYRVQDLDPRQVLGGPKRPARGTLGFPKRSGAGHDLSRHRPLHNNRMTPEADGKEARRPSAITPE